MHTPGPWIAEGNEMNATVWVRGPDGKRVCSVKRCETDFDNARLIAASPDLHAYAECEEARSFGEDVAETVLKQHGWNPSACTSHEFMDKMRRAALAKVRG